MPLKEIPSYLKKELMDCLHQPPSKKPFIRSFLPESPQYIKKSKIFIDLKMRRFQITYFPFSPLIPLKIVLPVLSNLNPTFASPDQIGPL